jgi:hypothetical protein
MKKLSLISSLLLTIASVSLGASGQTFSIGADGVRTVTINASRIMVAQQNVLRPEVQQSDRATTSAIQNHSSLKTLFSNLSDYRFATYFCCSGVVISGPDAKFGPGTFWIAVPFTPKEDAALTQVEAPFFSIAGAPSIAVSLASDASGVPGGTIAGPIELNNLPLIGGCCKLSVVRFGNIALAKGTQYWIIVGTDSNSADSNDSWQANTTDMRSHPRAIYSNGAWTARTGSIPAIGIFGK